jgi:hypothetical protein
MERQISFVIIYEEKLYPVQTWEHEYDSLMCLISDLFPTHNFGICYGGGSCGTCGIRMKEHISDAGNFMPSCEVPVDTRLSGKIVECL